MRSKNRKASRHRAPFLGATLLLASLTIAACASRGGNIDDDLVIEEEGTPDTSVEVINQNWSSVHVYVVRERQQISLGVLPPGNTETYTLPRGTLVSPRHLRFFANVIGGSRNYLSDDIYVTPGAQVVWRIENDLDLTSIAVY